MLHPDVAKCLKGRFDADVWNSSADDVLAAAANPEQQAAIEAGGFETRTPLWFYILAEAEQAVVEAFKANPEVDPQTLGTRLTGVGAAIVKTASSRAYRTQ